MTTSTSVPWKPVGLFVLLAYVLAWLVCLPAWFQAPGGRALWMGIGAAVMMFSPAVAAIIVARFVERTPVRAAIGFTWTGWRPLLIWSGIAVGLIIVYCAGALLTGALLGQYHPDLVNYSGYRQAIEAQLAASGQPMPPMPIAALVWIQVAAMIPSSVVNAVLASGEELGWRGWLFPRLLPLGRIPAILLSGVIWGAWHAPLLLLGYNYPGAPGWLAVLMMCGFCTMLVPVLGWVRMRSGTVWPAAIGHGAVNAMAGSYLLFSDAARPTDTVDASLLGWSGWVIPVLVGAWLLARGGWPSARPAAVPAGSAPSRTARSS